MQPSLKSCSDQSELSSLDVTSPGALGAAHPPALSRSMLWSSRPFTLGPGWFPIFTTSPLPKRGSGMDTKALCGWKEGSIAKANCGLSCGGGGNGRYRVYSAGCASSCWWDTADLTCLAFNTLLQHDLHQIALLEHLVVHRFPADLSRARVLSGNNTGSRSGRLCHNPHPTNFLNQDTQRCASDLPKARKKAGSGFFFSKKLKTITVLL